LQRYRPSPYQRTRYRSRSNAASCSAVGLAATPRTTTLPTIVATASCKAAGAARHRCSSELQRCPPSLQQRAATLPVIAAAASCNTARHRCSSELQRCPPSLQQRAATRCQPRRRSELQHVASLAAEASCKALPTRRNSELQRSISLTAALRSSAATCH
jgi:hypothetical protein